MSQSLTMKQDVAGSGFLAGLLRFAFPHASLWFLTIVMAAANFTIAGASEEISLDPFYLTILEFFYGLAFVLVVARWARPQLFDWFLHRVWGTVMCLLLMISFTTNLGVLNFIVMTQNWPYADQLLIAGDKLLGFDWLTYSKFMTSAETSRGILHFFYNEVTRVGMFALPLLALLLNNRIRLCETVFMIFVTGILAVLVSGFFPALGPWTLLADQELLDRISWSAPVNYLDMMTYLRGSGPVHIDLSKLIGLSSCPSYHTCLALCFIVATRGYRGLNMLGGLACVTIIAATPIYGTHYLMDLLAGGLTMAVTYHVWSRFVRPLVTPVLAASGDDAFDFPQAIMNLRIPGSAAKRQA
jgi:PAP2 superfamily